jgi:hypothetical protein
VAVAETVEQAEHRLQVELQVDIMETQRVCVQAGQQEQMVHSDKVEVVQPFIIMELVLAAAVAADITVAVLVEMDLIQHRVAVAAADHLTPRLLSLL